MPGWGTYNKKRAKKSKAAEPLTRHELSRKFPGTLDELIKLAARCKMKPKRLPYSPPEDQDPAPLPVAEGPCRDHVEAHRRWRAVKARATRR
jgi:hypothetical protein